MSLRSLLLLVLICLVFGKRNGNKLTNDNAFKALKSLHEELDDDHDGKVNEAESADYMKEKELTDTNGKQHQMFEHDPDHDHQLSVDELWVKWTQSPVFKWNVEEVIHWLKYTVNLPEHSRIFRKNKISGKQIPRLATPQDPFLQKELKIGNGQHRKRIYIRASDLILFGVPNDFKPLQSDKSFLAIKAVHTHLDDDSDGKIDAGESQEYFDEELETRSSKRHLLLHTHDDQISVDELWESWQESDVYRWTTDQVIDWLKNVVGLPQYEKTFREKKINGKCIPRIATDKSQFLQNELGMQNPKHRRKIYLRASDIILFGAPEAASSRFNDTIVAVIVVVASLICLYAFREKRITKMQVENMSKDLLTLQQAEENLKAMQDTLAEAEQRQQSNDEGNSEREKHLLTEIEQAKKEAERLHQERGHSQEEKIKLALVEQELSEVRLALAKAEIEMRLNKTRNPQALQEWLQRTYQLESEHFQMHKNMAMTQMSDAKDACEKVSKARGSMFGSLRLVHGQSIDVVDQKIINARGSLAEVTNMLQERQHRWSQIENLCNFSIVNDGLFANMPKKLRKTSLQQALADVASLTLSVPVVETIDEEEEEETDDAFRVAPSSVVRASGASLKNSRENSFESVSGSSTGSRQASIISTQSCLVESNLQSQADDKMKRSNDVMKGSNDVVSKPLSRSASEKFDNPRVSEKKIQRVSTEPNDISRKALANVMNGKFKSNGDLRPQSDNLSNGQKLFTSSSTENVQKTSTSSLSLNAGSEGDNVSDSGNISDESTFSTFSTTSKKKKRNRLGNIFHRKHKDGR